MTRTVFSTTTSELSEFLGLGERVLRQLRADGVLQAGKHYRHVGAGCVRPRIRWNLAAVEEALTHRSRRLRVG